jgi:hypothetical protein
MEDYVAEC